MKFKVIDRRSEVRPSFDAIGYLIRDRWNDFSYRTNFVLVFCMGNSETEIGAVKIAHRGMTRVQKSGGPDTTDTQLENRFTALSDQYFSVGQEDLYYENLNKLGRERRIEILIALQDVAFDLDIFERNRSEDVFKTSLLRNLSEQLIRTQFHRISNGGVRRAGFKMLFHGRLDAGLPFNIDFEVIPESLPPSNVHAVIGRNGVGKTSLLRRIEASVLGLGLRESGDASFDLIDHDANGYGFNTLITVAFSAFDPFNADGYRKAASAIGFEYIGLKKSGEELNTHKSLQELRAEFANGLDNCRGVRAKRLDAALKILASDPIIEASAFNDRSYPLNVEAQFSKSQDELTNEFNELSSGHKLVLLSIVRLVQLVEERTLVLIDEPETHLHPPLLSAFIRAISSLLIERNGVAIIATHSPVVLQEVSRHCAWKLSRSGEHVKAERPSIETFGENVGTLTREVFGLEVARSGFYKMLEDAVDELGSYEAVLAKFEGRLGAEARGVVRVLITEKKASS